MEVGVRAPATRFLFSVGSPGPLPPAHILCPPIQMSDGHQLQRQKESGQGAASPVTVTTDSALSVDNVQRILQQREGEGARGLLRLVISGGSLRLAPETEAEAEAETEAEADEVGRGHDEL